MLLTNAYISFVKFHRIHGKKVKKTHYEFIKDVALAWIKPDMYWPGWNTRKRAAVASISRSVDTSDEQTTVTEYSSSSHSTMNTRLRSCTRRRLLPEEERRGGVAAVGKQGCGKKSVAKKQQQVAKRMNNASLHPLTGSMRERLNPSIGHNPVISKERGRCQLHRWARGREGKDI